MIFCLSWRSSGFMLNSMLIGHLHSHHGSEGPHLLLTVVNKKQTLKNVINYSKDVSCNGLCKGVARA
jgi:hypothetical protein